MYYLCSENKDADQLRGYREADLRLCFRICKKTVFSRRGSYKHKLLSDKTITIIFVQRQVSDQPACFMWKVKALIRLAVHVVPVLVLSDSHPEEAYFQELQHYRWFLLFLFL